MFRKTLALLCLAALSFAKTPRPLASVPIHTPQNKPIDLKKFRGKGLVLVIFSTQCEDCIATLQLLDSVQKQFGPQGLQVVAAAGDDNAPYLIGSYIARYKPSFPIGYLNKDEIIKIADVEKGARPFVPIILFIDRWGMVRYQYYGDHPIFKDPNNVKSMSLAMTKVQPLPAGGAKTAPKAQQ